MKECRLNYVMDKKKKHLTKIMYKYILWFIRRIRCSNLLNVEMQVSYYIESGKSTLWAYEIPGL